MIIDFYVPVQFDSRHKCNIFKNDILFFPKDCIHHYDLLTFLRSSSKRDFSN